MSTPVSVGAGDDGRSERRLEIPLRPGVVFPDWSAVTSGTVREALETVFGLMRVEEGWAGLSAEEDRLRVAILTLYRELGHPPDAGAIAKATGVSRERVAALLPQLKTRDMVVLDPESGEITGAYPFTERRTDHRVRLGGTTLNAMCAIDALGAGAMYGADAAIESSCRHCRAEIRITTREAGEVVGEATPPETVVWFGIHYQDQAATSLCTVLAFFCCDAHLEAWRVENSGPNGYRLSLDEGMQAGKAIFTPFLAAAADA